MSTRLARLLLTASLFGCAAAPAVAQVRPGVYGYVVRGQAGIAGEFCHVFDCTPRLLTVSRGETLSLEVNAPFMTPYALGLAFSATSCLSSPLFGNALILDLPIELLAVGLVDQGSPILSCWGGTRQNLLFVPPTVPLGLQFSTQALAVVPTLQGDQASFSVAVTCTVR
jgi:hypothetical protein